MEWQGGNGGSGMRGQYNMGSTSGESRAGAFARGWGGKDGEDNEE